MRIFKFPTALLATFSILLSSCAQSSKDHSKSMSRKIADQTLRINICTEPGTLDPRKARGLNDQNVIKMLQDGLTRVNSEGIAKAALAEKTIKISEDQKTYTFTIKETKWSNGDCLTSHDFANSWKKTLAPSFPSPYAYLLYAIKNAKNVKEGKVPASMLGIQTPDDKTLVVHLEQPVPYFLELLATPVFFPVPSNLDSTTPNWCDHAETYVSCGPFQMKEWKHASELALVKNLSYWDAGAVKLQKILMFMVPSETGFNMYKNNEIDWDGSPLSTIPLDAMESLTSSGELKTQSILSTTFLRTNVEKAPFTSQKVRKAFAYALDRNSIIQNILLGHCDYASGLVPKIMGLRDKEYFVDVNKAEASSILETALKEGEISKKELDKVKLTFISREKSFRLAQILKEQLREAFNIEVELEPLEAQVYFSRISSKDYQMTLSSWEADFRDPVNFLEVFKTKEIGTNNTNWQSDSYVEKLQQSYEAKDPSERKSLLQACEQILINEMPIIPLFHGKMHYVKNEKVKNVVLSESGGIDFKWAFIDKSN